MKSQFQTNRVAGNRTRGTRSESSNLVRSLKLTPTAMAEPVRIRIRLSEHGIRQTFAARASGFGFAIPGFGARCWFR